MIPAQQVKPYVKISKNDDDTQAGVCGTVPSEDAFVVVPQFMIVY